MRAIQIIEPRKIAMLDDVPTPEPTEGEVLVKCSHVALCGSNMGQYTGEGLWGAIEFPNPVGWAGHENIGTIVKSRCDGWEEGTLVLAQPHGYYGFAEYIISRPPAIARLPQDAPDPGALVVAQPLATVLRALTRTDDVINKSCVVIGQGPQKGERASNVVVSQDQQSVEPLMDVVVDLAQLGHDAFVGPALNRAAQIDADDLAQHPGVHTLHVVRRYGHFHSSCVKWIETWTRATRGCPPF